MVDLIRTDDILSRIARGQLGLVTYRQAIAAGVSASSFDRRRQSRLWSPAAPGVVRSAVVRPTVEQRMLAGALAVPGSILIGPSAALVDGMPVGTQGAVIPVVAVGAGRSARTAGVRVVRLSVALPTRVWHGVRVTAPSATLVTLPRFVSRERLERCLDHCLVSRLTTVERVRSLVESLPPRSVPGRLVLLRLLAARAELGIGHRSGEEQTVGGWLDAAGLSGWQANFPVPVGGGETVEGDFVWVEPMVVLEVSPFFTHGSRAAQERDIERRRQLVPAGWRVVEAGDPDLVDERSFAPCAALLRRMLDLRPAA